MKRVAPPKVKQESKVAKPGSFGAKPTQSKFGKAKAGSSNNNSLKAMLELKKQQEKEKASLNLMDFMS